MLIGDLDTVCVSTGQLKVGDFTSFSRHGALLTGKIALAVLLAVAILALLAVLTYCFLRARKKHSHRPVATSPAHEAVSDQDATVYNSTTKPI